MGAIENSNDRERVLKNVICESSQADDFDSE